MSAYLPPITFVVAWLLSLFGVPAIGTDSSTPFAELALRWMLFFGAGWSVLGGFVMHTVFARQTAKDIGWQTNSFQYEVGFASLAMGLGSIYASTVDQPAAWSWRRSRVVCSCSSPESTMSSRSSVSATTRPANTMILISDLGIPLSLLALLIATGAIL